MGIGALPGVHTKAEEPGPPDGPGPPVKCRPSNAGESVGKLCGSHTPNADLPVGLSKDICNVPSSFDDPLPEV